MPSSTCALLMISGVFVLLNVVCRMYQLYSTNLVCLASERFMYWVWLESLFIGSYVYHSDVIAGTQLCY